jgi:asparagine synthase (glutamine-hydrolysing)
MCAITGIFRFQGRITPAESVGIRRMLAAQAHRGPDDEGLFIHDRTLLGHRRLSILDTSSAGHQPFPNPDGSVQVVFNGEIYNFRELRRDLEAAGRRFVSQTDTEVLVHGYEVWGVEGLLSRLRGMFAFALFDAAPGRGGPKLILARDRFGIKPLYYFQDPEKIVFASEVRALVAGRLAAGEIDSGGLLQFLQLGSVPAPRTTRRGIRSLPAGHVLVLKETPGEPRPYWFLAKMLEAAPDPMPHAEAVRRARRLLEDTVKHHLISDVPLGIFLSGGIDSSALVGLASAVGAQDLTTLSVTFEESAYNEASFARRVAEHYGTKHHEVQVRYAEFREELPQILAAMDQPTVDGVNTYIVSKAAREAGLTVVLSGLGADELFSGYRHLRRARQIEARLRAAALVPGFLRRLFLREAEPLIKGIFPRLARKTWCLEHITAATPWWIARGLFSPAQSAALTGASQEDCRRAQMDAAPPEALRGLSPEERVRYLEYALYLQNQLLKDSDVMSMAHSLELRVPFMDHELVAGILKLPTGGKLSSPVPKRLLVEAMGPDFPREVWARPKQGFTFPLDAWLRRDNGEFEAMAVDRTPLERSAVRKVWSDFRAGRQHWSRAWMTVIAARFYGGAS